MLLDLKLIHWAIVWERFELYSIKVVISKRKDFHSNFVEVPDFALMFNEICL